MIAAGVATYQCCYGYLFCFQQAPVERLRREFQHPENRMCLGWSKLTPEPSFIWVSWLCRY